MPVRTLFTAAAVIALSACSTTINTLPAVATPGDAVQRYDLEIPSDLDVKSIDFTATTSTDVSKIGGELSSATAGRAFVKVHAVQRGSGDHFLLLYEDIGRRRQPIQVIRLVPGTTERP